MIYFIQGGTHIKIGTARDVRRRLKLLQTGCPHRLVVLGTMDGDGWQEKELHAKFAHHWCRGEWFIPGDDLCTFIESNSRPWLHGLRDTGAVPSAAAPRDLTPQDATFGLSTVSALVGLSLVGLAIVVDPRGLEQVAIFGVLLIFSAALGWWFGFLAPLALHAYRKARTERESRQMIAILKRAIANPA